MPPRGKKKKGQSKKSAKNVATSQQPQSTHVEPAVKAEYKKSSPSSKPAFHIAPTASAEISNEDLYKQLREQKNYVGLNNLGCRLIESKTENVEKKRKKEILALICFEMAASQNNAAAAIAQANLARCYLTGKGVPKKDLAKAAEWLRKAAKNGNLNAKVQWAIYCWKTKTNPSLKEEKSSDLDEEIITHLEDEVRAILQEVADQKNVYAQYYLGILYSLKMIKQNSNGKPLISDQKEGIKYVENAEKCFELAAAQGSVGAKHLLASLQYVEQKIDDKQLHEILIKTQSDPDARCFLAHMLRIKDPESAHTLFEKGIKENHLPSILMCGIYELEKLRVHSIEFKKALEEVIRMAKMGFESAIQFIFQYSKNHDFLLKIAKNKSLLPIINSGLRNIPPPQDRISIWINDYHDELEKILLRIKNKDEKDFEEIFVPELSNDLKPSAETSITAAVLADKKVDTKTIANAADALSESAKPDPASVVCASLQTLPFMREGFGSLFVNHDFERTPDRLRFNASMPAQVPIAPMSWQLMFPAGMSASSSAIYLNREVKALPAPTSFPFFYRNYADFIRQIFASEGSYFDIRLLGILSSAELAAFKQLLSLMQTMTKNSSLVVVQIKSDLLVHALLNLNKDFPRLDGLNLQLQIPKQFYPDKAVEQLMVMGFEITEYQCQSEEKQSGASLNFVNMRKKVSDNCCFDVTLIERGGRFHANDNLIFTRELMYVHYDQDKIWLSKTISLQFWAYFKDDNYFLELKYFKKIGNKGADYAHLFNWYLKFQELLRQEKVKLSHRFSKTIFDLNTQKDYLRDLYVNDKAHFYKEFVQLMKYKIFDNVVVKDLLINFITILVEVLIVKNIIAKSDMVNTIILNIYERLLTNYAYQIKIHTNFNQDKWLCGALKIALVGGLEAVKTVASIDLSCLEMEKFLSLSIPPPHLALMQNTVAQPHFPTAPTAVVRLSI